VLFGRVGVVDEGEQPPLRADGQPDVAADAAAVLDDGFRLALRCRRLADDQDGVVPRLEFLDEPIGRDEGEVGFRGVVGAHVG
jgi:hypothetical protein